MRLCYVVSEYFKWGQFGGYGTIARAVAEGLVQRGHEVFALVPKRSEEAKRSQRDSNDNHTMAGLKTALVNALEVHAAYVADRAEMGQRLAGKTGPEPLWRYAEKLGKLIAGERGNTPEHAPSVVPYPCPGPRPFSLPLPLPAPRRP